MKTYIVVPTIWLNKVTKDSRRKTSKVYLIRALASKRGNRTGNVKQFQSDPLSSAPSQVSSSNRSFGYIPDTGHIADILTCRASLSLFRPRGYTLIGKLEKCILPPSVGMIDYIVRNVWLVQAQPASAGHIVVHSSQPTIVRSGNVQVCTTHYTQLHLCMA